MATIGKDYFPNRDGMRELGRSQGIQNASLEAASSVLQTVTQIDRRGSYTSGPTDVTVGYDNDRRAGAYVQETERRGGGRLRALRRAAGSS